ncbi:alpha/beta fold hydrolase [Tabrizicola flagellatus]|uniref:alpha/beta fold hydrolase n=1 Tax=Tabrizicola flagellatus TaxID=2593021 RepID=UPI0011F2E0F4|nr:alpha/beta hydrolase [Tabrizicola flagellatus]
MPALYRCFPRILLLCAAGLLSLTVAGAAVGVLCVQTLRDEIADRRRIDSPNGIELTETVMIGGIPQVINIRGRDRDNPVLLYLHGGPGTPMLPIAHVFQDRWEDHFTVVQWDQRGAGKTYALTPPEEIAASMSFDRMTADVIEMADHLRARFGQDRIVLLGHSWGSMIGIAAVMEHPDRFSVYVGTGQAINTLESERLGYAHTLMRARQIGLSEAVAELEALAPYPEPPTVMDKHSMRHRWNAHFGEGVFGYQSLASALIRIALVSPDYGWRDLWTLMAEDETPYLPLDPDLVAFDALRWGTAWQVPVVFIEGKQDWQVNHQLVRDYFDNICAPYKAFVYLDEAAHAPMVEQPDRFADALIRLVRPLVTDGVPPGPPKAEVLEPAGYTAASGACIQPI